MEKSLFRANINQTSISNVLKLLENKAEIGKCIVYKNKYIFLFNSKLYWIDLPKVTTVLMLVNCLPFRIKYTNLMSSMPLYPY